MAKPKLHTHTDAALIKKLAAQFVIGDTMGYTAADGWDRARRDALPDREAAKLFVKNPQLIDDPEADALRAEGRLLFKT